MTESRFAVIVPFVLAGLVLVGCSGKDEKEEEMEEVPMSLAITTDAFAPNGPIPQKYTGEGDNVSPALSWSGVPQQAKELALICDDPDAPRKDPWVHWVIYNIPVDVTGLPEGVPAVAQPESPAGVKQGLNSWPDGENVGYGGPMPPPGHGVHHYHFKLYALDATIDLDPGTASKEALLAAIKDHVLAQGEIVGTYERK